MNEEQTSHIRPSWDEYFFNICKAVAIRSHDVETKIGCVITSPQHRIVSTGYNGLPAGVDDSFWAKDRATKIQLPGIFDDAAVYEIDKYDTVTHAEANAIVSASCDLHGCTLYSILCPCHECAKLIITAGIRRIVYRDLWRGKANAVALKLFEQAGIEMVRVAPDSTVVS